ncbi:MAG: SWIM/SEC-C metal-binding protein [Paraglaciecola sp.]|jgi:SWIM/SEC-C metal-binding protein
MSKLFFKGRIDARENYQRFGYNTKRESKLGTVNSPLTLRVDSEERKGEIEALLLEYSLTANIQLDSQQLEDVAELDAVLNKPVTVKFALTPKRNDLCNCASGKKYKKCCGQ